jgi:hypothetical protein
VSQGEQIGPNLLVWQIFTKTFFLPKNNLNVDKVLKQGMQIDSTQYKIIIGNFGPNVHPLFFLKTYSFTLVVSPLS